MKASYITYTIFQIYILVFICLFSNQAMSQQKGKFDKQITQGSFTGQVSFYVPESEAPAEGFPIIIGLHPAQTPGSAMRDMIFNAAQTIGAILACPEGPDGDASAIFPLIDWIKNSYGIDEKKIFLTGYSAGGYPAIKTGLANVTKFRGLIGIAPAISSLEVNTDKVAQIAIAIIVGKDDLMYSGLKDVIQVINNNGGATKFIEKTGVGHTGEYFWGTEFATDWKACYDFCINTVLKPIKVNLLKPMDAAQGQPIQIDLTWDKVLNCTGYKIIVSTSEGVYKSDLVTVEKYNLPDLQKNTKYSWKVCAVNSSGDGPWSDTWTFTTLNDAPSGDVVLLEPENNAELKGPDLLFKWQTVANATKYHFQIYEDESSILIAQDSNITTENSFAQYSATKLKAGTKYKWHVRAFSKYGSTPWSVDRFVTTIPNPPTAKCTLQEPVNNATNQTLNLKFKWNVVTNGDKYHLLIKNKNTEETFYEDSTIAKPTSGSYKEVYVNGLSSETPYTWQVRSLNKGGYGPWSNIFSFTTKSANSVMENITSIFKANIYPNPAEGNAVLSFTLPKDGESNIELFNSFGEKCEFSFDKIYAAGDYKVNLNVQGYPVGVYYVKIISDNKFEIKELLIVK